MTKDGVQNVKQMHESALSFWNIIAPTDLDAYWGEPTHKVDLGNFAESYTKALAQDMGWWCWNVREWGCKWDACEIEVQDDFTHGGKLTIGYKFDTPWSPPLEAIEKLAKQYPDLIINIEYEEEQGWGGDVTLQGDNVLQREEWDIPDSHAENMLRRSEVCWRCESYGSGFMQASELYEDCPNYKEEE
jgi:hypothetical protein